MKIIIAGGRDFNDYKSLERCVTKFLQSIKLEEIIIVSGCAKGADTLGEYFAKFNGFKIEKFPADWNQFPRSAGYIRNKEMAKFADYLIVFWDGKSKGTRNMIDEMKKLNKPILALKYN